MCTRKFDLHVQHANGKIYWRHKTQSMSEDSEAQISIWNSAVNEHI